MKPVGPPDSRGDLATSPSTSSENNGGAGAKRRKTTSGTSSRGVANLTPEQLAKKRANDREAQRAIRERTRTQIEGLEKQIADLKAQHPYQELQQALKKKDLIQAENEDIRQQLASALSILQPILNERRANGQAPLIDSSSLPQSIHSLPIYQAAPTHLASTPPANLSTPGSTVPDTASGGSVPSPSTVQAEPTRKPGWPAAGEAYSSQHHLAQKHSPNSSLTYQRGRVPVPGERHGLEFLLDGSQNAPKIATSIAGAASADPTSARSPSKSATATVPPVDAFRETTHMPQGVPYAAPIRNIAATCPLDNLLLDFLGERQVLAANGLPTAELQGPPYPSIASLVYPERSVYSHPTSKVFTDILSKFPDLSTLPEQIAVLYVMFLIMRWQICPTQENYDRLPDWVTPRPSQLFTPHPAWVDHLPWPRMRDVLVREHRSVPFETFFIPFTTTLSLNWPYEPTDTMISSSESDEVKINPVFERHLRNLNNWSLGPAFAKAFPQLVDAVRLEPHAERASWRS